MAYAAQRDAVVAVLEAVPNIGRVHSRPRYGDAHDHWVATIDGIEQVRSWEVGVGEPGLTRRRLQQNHRHKYSSIEIRGYVGLDDERASYDALIDLAEQIAEGLDADRTLGGTFLDMDPAEIEEPVVVTIGGGFLCWAITVRIVGYEVTQP